MLTQCASSVPPGSFEFIVEVQRKWNCSFAEQEGGEIEFLLPSWPFPIIQKITMKIVEFRMNVKWKWKNVHSMIVVILWGSNTWSKKIHFIVLSPWDQHGTRNNQQLWLTTNSKQATTSKNKNNNKKPTMMTNSNQQQSAAMRNKQQTTNSQKAMTSNNQTNDQEATTTRNAMVWQPKANKQQQATTQRNKEQGTTKNNEQQATASNNNKHNQQGTTKGTTTNNDQQLATSGRTSNKHPTVDKQQQQQATTINQLATTNSHKYNDVQDSVISWQHIIFNESFSWLNDWFHSTSVIVNCKTMTFKYNRKQ